jgi:hypothetical protein
MDSPSELDVGLTLDIEGAQLPQSPLHDEVHSPPDPLAEYLPVSRSCV